MDIDVVWIPVGGGKGYIESRGSKRFCEGESDGTEKGHSMRHFLGPLGFFGVGGSRAATIACERKDNVSWSSLT